MPSLTRQYRLAWTLCAAALLLFSLVGCDQTKTADDYLKRAQTSRAAGDISAAINDVKSALQKNPKNLTARVLLAQFYLDLPDPVSAEAVLWRARQDGASDTVIAKPLARAQLLMGKSQLVLQTNELSGDAPPGLRASLMAIKAEAYIGLGRARNAHDALEAGLKLDPHSIDVLATMARYALAMGDADTAQKRLAEAQKEGAENTSLLDLEGDVAFAVQDYSASTRAYKRLREAQPWSLAARLGLARAEIAEGSTADADANLAVVLRVSPNDPQANHLSALIAYKNNNYVVAQSRIQRALNAVQDYPPALLLAGASAYALHQYEQANVFLSQYVHQVPQYVEARKLLAAVRIVLGRPADAVNVLSPLVDTEPADAQIFALIGAASAQLGDFAAADRYLGKALALQPNNAAIRTQLGITRLALGQVEAGIDALEEASREDPSALRPDVALFIAYFRQEDYAKALEAAKRLEKAYPNEASGFDFAGATYFAQANEPAARDEFRKARELRPGDSIACRSLAILAVRGGDLAMAVQLYTEILTANPKDTGASVALADLQDQQGQRGAAIATLQKAIEQNAGDLAPRVSLGRAYILDRNYQGALGAVEPALASAPKNVALLEVAGQARFALGDIDAALSTFKALVELQPQSSFGQRYLAATYLAAGQPDLAFSQANIAVEADPNDPAAKMILARVDMAKGSFGAARLVLDELAAKYPNDALIAELQRGAGSDQNGPQDAVVAQAADDDGAARTHLAVAQARAGQFEEAKRTLLEWLAARPKDLTPRQALADIYLASHQLDEAQSQYEAVLAAAPDNSAVENNLAWVLSRKGDAQGALAHAHHAASLAPDAPRVLDTLGVVLLQNHMIAEAMKPLAKAAQTMPTDPEIQFHFAQALLGAGNKEQARGVLRAVLADKQSFEDQEQARSLLQNLGG